MTTQQNLINRYVEMILAPGAFLDDRQIQPGEFYTFLDGEGKLDFVSYLCPCGCGTQTSHKIVPAGVPHDKHTWEYKKPGYLLFPSVLRTGGCGAHYFIRGDGTVEWSPAPPSRANTAQPPRSSAMTDTQAPASFPISTPAPAATDTPTPPAPPAFKIMDRVTGHPHKHATEVYEGVVTGIDGEHLSVRPDTKYNVDRVSGDRVLAPSGPLPSAVVMLAADCKLL